MKLSIGIIGLPNVGKSTLFQVITGQEVNVANYPFATVDKNVGVVAARDERLDKVAEVMGSAKVLPAVFEFVDIAGLVKGAHEGKGLGNQFLGHVREVDAVLHVVRVFKDGSVVHVEGELDPVRDLEIVLEELRKKDEESKEVENLLSKKPQLILLNGSRAGVSDAFRVRLKELDFPYVVADLGSENVKVLHFNHDRGGSVTFGVLLGDITGVFARLLGLITFFTANENETRSWFVRKGILVPEAAGVVHTDFEEKFIKAEVIHWEKLLEAGSWSAARQKGWVRLEGKEYGVEEGDVILVRSG